AHTFRCFEDCGQVHLYFFYPAAGHDRDPLLANVELVLRGILSTLNGWQGKIRQRMSNEDGINTSIAIEPFFEGEDNERLLDVFPQQLYPALPPCPELWTHVVQDGDPTLMHLPGDPPIECGGIDHYGESRFAAIRF